MSASDEVAGLPGGEALAALAAQVRGNPGAIRDIANRWSEAAGDCAAHAGSVKAAVRRMSRRTGRARRPRRSPPSWAGSARRASAAERALGRPRGPYAGPRARSRRRRSPSRASVRTCSVRCRGCVRRNPDATPSQLSGQISGLTSEAADAARVKGAEAQQSLGIAQQALSGDLSRLSRTFSALPEAGTANFMRGWGQPNGWLPAPQGTLSGRGKRRGRWHGQRRARPVRFRGHARVIGRGTRLRFPRRPAGRHAAARRRRSAASI